SFRRGPKDNFIFQVEDHTKTVGVQFRLPNAREVRLACRRPRRWSRKVRLAVRCSGNVRCAPVEPLSIQRNWKQQYRCGDREFLHDGFVLIELIMKGVSSRSP